MARITFICGTDTGAGKTLLTGLLLTHALRHGSRARAIKPIASGGPGDARLLHKLQPQVSMTELVPFQFERPLAPLLAARAEGRRVLPSAVIRIIKRQAAQSDILIVEGAGGLLAPLGEGFSNLEVIAALECAVIIAARNRLGVVNQVRLTSECLQSRGIAVPAVVLMGMGHADESCRQNSGLLQELIGASLVLEVPFLGRNTGSSAGIKRAEKKLKNVLEALAKVTIFSGT